MQRRFMPLFWACTLLLLLLTAVGQAQGASYVVAPFQVNGPDGYSYLSKAIPPMLSSRLFWQDNYVPANGQDNAVQGAVPQNSDAAAKLRLGQRADYVIWGSVTILGKEASLDVKVLDAADKLWQRSSQSQVDNLIGGMQLMADAINAEVFGRPVISTASRPAPSNTRTSMNPEIMMNENRADAVYMNPELRYQGSDTERTRSQQLEFESRGMEIADINGDGQNEVLLLGKNSLQAYSMRVSRLDLLDSFSFPGVVDPLLVRHVKQGGRDLIIVACNDTNGRMAQSYVFTFTNNKLEVVNARVPYYLNVVKLAPHYVPTLVAQAGDNNSVVRGPVFELLMQGNQYVRGENIPNLPREANVFNFAWLSGGRNSGGDYLIAIGPSDNILSFDRSGRRLSKTEEIYAATSIGIAYDNALPGMVSSSDLPRYYYVPMRMLPVDLDQDGVQELIVSKPISTAGQMFSGYRTYPQGEVHGMLWDGVGMELLWKSRRLSGTLVDIAVADVNNDGILDLVVNSNSHPGAFGVGKIRTVITFYPLDLSKTSPSSVFSAE